MSIDYKILWFEDQINFIDEQKSIFLEEYIESLGFDIIIDHKPLNDVNENDLSKYDIILVDLDLNSDLKGNDIISKIRDLKVYTEVVFYSVDTAGLKKAVQENGLEGVYTSSRKNEDFESKVKKIIELTVKKLEELNNLRGLVMAETSDIDSLIREMIVKIDNISNFDKKSLAKYCLKKIEEHFTDHIKKFEEIKEHNLLKITNHKLFEANKLFRALVKFYELYKKVDENLEFKLLFDSIADYDEMQENRNILAHAKEINNKDGKKVLKGLKSDSEPIIFDENFCKDIRSKLRIYRKAFLKINEHLDRLITPCST